MSALLTAASYLQLSDLAALCRRTLKSSSSKKTPSSTATSLTLNGHLFYPHRPSCAPLRLSDNHHSKEVARSHKQIQKGHQREDLSEEELYFAQYLSLNPSPVVKINNSAEMGLDLSLQLTTKSPTGSTATEEISPSSLQQGSPQSGTHSTSNSASSDDIPSDSTSAFCNQRPEQGDVQQHPKAATDSQQNAGRKRPRSSSESSLETMDKVQGKSQGVASGELDRGEERVPSELEDQEEIREAEATLENDLENSEKSIQSENEEEQTNGNKNASHIYQPQPGFEPALDDYLYVCIPCKRAFPTSEQLNTHVESHTAEELNIKVRDVEERGSIKDEDQDQENPSKESHSTKGETTSDQMPPCHVCSICNKGYMDAALLRQHEKSHWLTRPFPCNICGRLFTQRGTMTRHMRGHLGLKPFACEECGMRFTRHYRLTEHMRVHTGEKPYGCQLCGRKFTQQRNLISHFRMHTLPS